ncbi:thioredoxin [Gemmobacter aquarius]|uniref:Thioredoxin n=1 Tax=Paragemmobacter aquarius TaxID=2169400 RepID=A0A2S0UNJ6_9RHOB|nr:thioredoxin family protein [Gemmobacter aquarius]AWB49389.1 thioredoxin [Gemmobacter aquarius]
MHRRDFLAMSASLTFLPRAARAGEATPYTPGAAEAAMDAGKIVFLDFWASWCSTCAAQHRVLAALKAENPAYEQNIVFFVVDWDEYGKGDLSKSLNIPRRSTLVAMKGLQELGRIVAGTSTEDIRALLDLALAAA